MGLNPLPCPVNVSIAVWPWGAYLGDEGIANGVRMKISSWQRHDPNAMPPAAKGTGMYINSSMAKIEALKAGYDEAILLSPQGYVSECTGENLFVVQGGRIITPPLSAGALEGITQDLGHDHRPRPRIRRGVRATSCGPICTPPTRRFSPARRPRWSRSPRSTTGCSATAGPARSPGGSRRFTTRPSAARSTSTRTGSNMSGDRSTRPSGGPGRYTSPCGPSHTRPAATTTCHQSCPTRSTSMTPPCATAASRRACRSPSTTSSGWPSSSTTSVSQYIEGGWPGANPKDAEFFRRAAAGELQLDHATLVAFGSTRKAGGRAETDPVLADMVDARTPVVCLVAKSAEWHVTETLRTTLTEAVDMVADSVGYLVSMGRRVFLDAEHFFDGYRANPRFSTRRILAAAGAGRRGRRAL